MARGVSLLGQQGRISKILDSISVYLFVIETLIDRLSARAACCYFGKPLTLGLNSLTARAEVAEPLCQRPFIPVDSSTSPRPSFLVLPLPLSSVESLRMAWGRRHTDDNGSDAGSDSNKEKKPKTRKPPNTAFRQQRLLAYAPILTPKTVLPLFFAVGIIFGPLGGLLLYASSKV